MQSDNQVPVKIKIKIKKIADKEDTLRTFQFYKHSDIANDFKLNIVKDSETTHDEVTVADIKFQTAPTTEDERNGVFIEDLLGIAYAKLSEYNRELPSRENSIALTHIEEAILNLIGRAAEREYRGVLGTDNE